MPDGLSQRASKRTSPAASGGGGGAPPGSCVVIDAFGKLAVGIAESNPTPSEGYAIAVGLSETNPSPSEGFAVKVSGPAETNPAPSDSFGTLTVGVAESNLTPADAYTEAITTAVAETNPSPSDVYGQLKLGYAEANASPADAFAKTLRYWLSGCTGTSGNVTSPGNANGSNDGATAVCQTVPAGAATATLTALCGTNVPSGISFATAVFRSWHQLQTTLSTSTAKVVCHSSTGLFADVTIETLSAINASNNHLSAPLVFDLVAAGVNTLAKLQSCQFLYSTTDAVAGVSPAVATIDAAAIELTGVF